MPFDANKHHRRSTRLAGYDYTQNGAYFVTICTARRDCLFGEVTNAGEMILNTLGCVVENNWFKSADIRKEIILDAFGVMPNHVHGIVMIMGEPPVGAHGRAPLPKSTSLFRPPRSLGSFMAGFKSAVTKQVNQILGTPYSPVWQSNFYDKIIWNEQMLDATRIYIENNPSNWVLDQENPAFQNKYN
jgi:putative transposase